MNFEYLQLAELRKLLDGKRSLQLNLLDIFLGPYKKKRFETRLLRVTEEQALAEAKRADEFLFNSPGENPLLCVYPYAARRLFCTKGIRTTAASKFLTNIFPVRRNLHKKNPRSKKASLWATNLEPVRARIFRGDFRLRADKNLWDKTRMPGGSSSGFRSGLRRISALGNGNGNRAGSIRQPASLSGVSGWNRHMAGFSRSRVIAMASSLDSIGAVAYSVEVGALGGILSGQDDKDSKPAR